MNPGLSGFSKKHNFDTEAKFVCRVEINYADLGKSTLIPAPSKFPSFVLRLPYAVE